MSSTGDNYESAVNKAEAVAEFEDTRRGFVGRFQNALHKRPALVPLIVLIILLLFFALAVDGIPIFHSLGLLEWLKSTGLTQWLVDIGYLTESNVENPRYRFFSPFGLTLILQQIQIVGIIGAAQALVILTAGIELSVGATMVFASVTMGLFSFRYFLPAFIGWDLCPGAEILYREVDGAQIIDGFANIEGWLCLYGPATLGILCGLLVGLIIGYINGWLVAVVKLPPFIVTLGMWQIVLAVNFIYSANETLRSQDVSDWFPPLQLLGGNANRDVVGLVEWWRGVEHGARRPSDTGQPVLDTLWQFNFTYGVILMVVLVILLAYVLRSTAWGRHVYAVGDDPDAAELSGVNVRRVLISVYVIAGFICALAGWALIGRIGSVSPTSGQFANIDSITAVVIGGISLFGGRGSIAGMFFGALIVGVCTLGLRLMGADAQWTYLLIGLLIIFAVAVDQWIRKVSA